MKLYVQFKKGSPHIYKATIPVEDKPAADGDETLHIILESGKFAKWLYITPNEQIAEIKKVKTDK